VNFSIINQPIMDRKHTISDNEEEEEKKIKKPKDSDSSSEEVKKKKSGKEKKLNPEPKSSTTTTTSSKDSGPWDLGGKKKASISSFKGKVYVDIREFYLSGATELPGKKGISLTPEQFDKLCQHVDNIKAELKKKS